MTDLFLHVFNISMTAGWIVLAALVLRVILRDRLPGWVRCALWGVAGVRLLFPVSWESIVSLIPSAEPVPPAITTAPVPSVNVGIPVVDAVINPVISQTMTPTPEYSVNPMQIAVAVGTAVWLVGVAAMLIYYVISTVRLHRRLAVSIPYRDNVYLCDHLPGPILVGVFRPRIYIPSGTDPKLYPHILAHEGNHLKRGDHVWKPLGFLLLSIYWINPLLWVAYVLLSRDMERACDEKTINGMSEDERIAYYLALVACSERKPTRQLPNPVGFGEHKIIERVKHMKKYKKPTVWATALCVLLIAVTAVCFLTNPVSDAKTDDPTTPPNGQETTGIGEETTETGTEEVTTAPMGESDVVSKHGIIPAAEVSDVKYAWLDRHGVSESRYSSVSLWLIGAFDGVYVMFVDGPVYYADAITLETIGEYRFQYPKSQHIEVYYNGRLYSLKGAYRNQLLTDEDISDIHSCYREYYEHKRERNGE